MKEANLFTATRTLIDSIGAKRFPLAPAHLLRLAVPDSYTVVSGYLGVARPVDLFDDFPTSKCELGPNAISLPARPVVSLPGTGHI